MENRNPNEKIAVNNAEMEVSAGNHGSIAAEEQHNMLEENPEMFTDENLESVANNLNSKNGTDENQENDSLQYKSSIDSLNLKESSSSADSLSISSFSNYTNNNDVILELLTNTPVTLEITNSSSSITLVKIKPFENAAPRKKSVQTEEATIPKRVAEKAQPKQKAPRKKAALRQRAGPSKKRSRYVAPVIPKRGRLRRNAAPPKKSVEKAPKSKAAQRKKAATAKRVVLHEKAGPSNKREVVEETGPSKKISPPTKAVLPEEAAPSEETALPGGSVPHQKPGPSKKIHKLKKKERKRKFLSLRDIIESDLLSDDELPMLKRQYCNSFRKCICQRNLGSRQRRTYKPHTCNYFENDD